MADDSATITVEPAERTRLNAWAAALEAVRSDRGLITLALLMAMMVSALEQTVVSTAFPTIIASLKGLDIYPWVFSAYLLASTISTPLYGKVADLLGRKRVLLFGLALFGSGSMLSGLAQSMPQLIAARVVQGFGAGAVAPIVVTLLGDLFTLDERAKVQALFSAVWGGSSLAGPALGGVLTDRLSWRWVFFVTVPFAVVSAWILVAKVKETVKRKEVLPIDWAGAALLAAGSGALLLTVLRGGGQWWLSGVGVFVLAVALLGLFVWRETRAADPVLPLDLLRTTHISVAILGGFLLGALIFGIDTYIPLFVQGVKGGSATDGGRTITPLFLSWALSVAVAARVVVRFGFKRTAFFGTIFGTLGMFGLALGAAYPRWSGPLFLASMLVVGLGMGPTSLSQILAVQSAVPWDRRGAATAAVMFFRTMGGALMVGLFGAALSFGLGLRLADEPGVDVAAALRPETHAKLSPATLAVVQEALGASLRDVFLMLAVMTSLSVACAMGLRGGRAASHEDAGRSHLPDEPQDDSAEAVLSAGLEP
jgi:EmrB/QacA subfamily drug resistance transporter